MTHAVGQGDLFACLGFYDVVEFYRVSCFQEYAFVAGMLFQVSFEGQESYRAVRVGKIMILGVDVTDGLLCLRVGDAIAGEHFFQGGEFAVEDLHYADKIAGVAYIHGVRECGDCGPGGICSCLQIGRDDVVGVAGSDKMFDGEA